MLQCAGKLDDFHISSIVTRVLGGLSADRVNDFSRAVTHWEEAWKLQTSEPMLSALWVEEVNFCVWGEMGLFVFLPSWLRLGAGHLGSSHDGQREAG